MYSEEELKEFANLLFIEINRLRDDGYIERLSKDIPLRIEYGSRFDDWKKELKVKRREQKINDILNGN